MANNVYPFKKRDPVENNGIRAAEMLRILAWLAIVIGSILFILNVSDFSGNNLWLMVAIGFLIAGMNIFVLGTIFKLLHSTVNQE
jgi:peptidoglycan/LPS O-acetylase OafA/YrhL